MENMRKGGYESHWAPTRDVTGHDGGPLPADRCFFGAPPPEIGPVLTAHSTMSAGYVPLPRPVRYGAMILSAPVSFVAALLLVNAVGIEGFWWGAVLLIVPLLGFFIVRHFVGNKQECSYVGRDGIARFRTGMSGQVKPDLVVLFRDVARLEPEFVKHLRSGVYSYSSYTFRWVLRDGPARTIVGTHNSERGVVRDIGPAHEFTFCLAAAAAWERYQAHRAPGSKVGSKR
jgi:hypothetical protein